MQYPPRRYAGLWLRVAGVESGHRGESPFDGSPEIQQVLLQYAENLSQSEPDWPPIRFLDIANPPALFTLHNECPAVPAEPVANLRNRLEKAARSNCDGAADQNCSCSEYVALGQIWARIYPGACQKTNLSASLAISNRWTHLSIF